MTSQECSRTFQHIPEGSRMFHGVPCDSKSHSPRRNSGNLARNSRIYAKCTEKSGEKSRIITRVIHVEVPNPLGEKRMRYRSIPRCPPVLYQLLHLFTKVFELLDVPVDDAFPPINIVLRLNMFTVCLKCMLVTNSVTRNQCTHPCVRTELVGQICSSQSDDPPAGSQSSLARQSRSHAAEGTRSL